MHRINNPKYLVSRWKLQGDGLDAMGRYPGVLTNAPTWAEFLKNNLQAIELDGDDAHVNVGDVAEFNAVSQFTIAFWVYQDVLNQTDWVFHKLLTSTNRVTILLFSDGKIYFDLSSGGSKLGTFDYNTLIPAKTWHHVAMVFDGSGVANADRLKAYVDGVQVALTFTGTIAAVTADLSGIDAKFGNTSASLDGKLHDMRLYNVPLTNDEILKLIHSPVPTY